MMTEESRRVTRDDERRWQQWAARIGLAMARNGYPS